MVWRTKSTLLRILTLLGISSLVLLFSMAPPYTVLSAWLWHVRHGDSVRVGRYEIPVPPHWMAMPPEWLGKRDDQTSIVLVNTAMPLTSPSIHHAHSVILASSPWNPVANPNLPFWENTQERWLQKNRVDPIEKQVFTVGSDKVECIGGDTSALPQLQNTDFVSLFCASTGPLNLMFTGEPSELANFYSLAQSIQKQ